jgi:hypothetical protein
MPSNYLQIPTMYCQIKNHVKSREAVQLLLCGARIEKEREARVDVVGIGRRESRRAAAEIQYRALQYHAGTVHELEADRGPAARAVRCAGNASRGASPTAGKREGFSF